METDSQIIKDVADIYAWLDEQLTQLDRSCRACGDCCDFETFGHRLYVTTPELMFFAEHVGPEIKDMPDGICPYRVEGRCSVYPYRFSGCRIFTCGGSDTEQENLLCEQAIHKFKALCVKYEVPYHYLYLKPGLKMLREGQVE